MTDQKEFFGRLVQALESGRIAYMLSGSLASGYYGQPRATNDIDVVIETDTRNLGLFLDSLGADYYVSKEAVRDALAQQAMFNIIDMRTGWKADLIIRKDRPFSRLEFGRRRKGRAMDIDCWVLSPEDVILSKLEWSVGQLSERQFQDACSVAVVQWECLDREYLQEWAKQLQVDGQLRELLGEAEKLRSRS